MTPLALISEDSSLKIARIEGEGGEWTAEVETALDMSSTGMAFMWPTWSPRGDSLAVSASSKRSDEPRLELWLYPDEADSGQPLFSNPRDSLQVIAPGLAHYVSWAPDMPAMAVVANMGNGLAVNLVATTPGGQTRRIVDGAPVYFAWSPDNRGLLIHQNANLLLFDLASDTPGPLSLQRARPSFRSPAWTPDGQTIIYARPRPGGGAIIMGVPRSELTGDTAEAEVLMESEGPVSFVPAQGYPHLRLAVLTLSNENLEGRKLTIFDPYLGTEEVVAEHAISGIAWAPNSRAIFAFEPQPTPDNTLVGLTRYDLNLGGECTGRTLLARFQPSIEFATMLNFHDQFAHSHQIVSPCGQWITFAGLALGNGGSGRRGFGPQNGCYIVPTDGSAPARRVAGGSIGFFPPRLAEMDG